MILVDSNVLIDISIADAAWHRWSVERVTELADSRRLVINPLIYAEVAAGYAAMAEADTFLDAGVFEREHLPWEAAFIAGQSFKLYRERGGLRSSVLSDFYIGAHAAVRGYALLTRDARRYRSYFPMVTLITPGEA